jgi:hypothetical protein
MVSVHCSWALVKVVSLQFKFRIILVLPIFWTMKLRSRRHKWESFWFLEQHMLLGMSFTLTV